MKSYELYEKIKENGKVEFEIEGSKAVVERMEDQWELNLLNGAVLIVFTAMDCIDSGSIDLILDGQCVANINTEQAA